MLDEFCERQRCGSGGTLNLYPRRHVEAEAEARRRALDHARSVVASYTSLPRWPCKRWRVHDRHNSVTTETLPVSVAPHPALAETAGWIELVYRRRARQLWSFARRLGLDAESAEEVMQEAFVRAMRLPVGSVADIDAWMFRVVRNLAMDAHRQSARRRTVREIAAPSAAPSENQEREERLALWQEVDRLPPRQRAVLYLRFRADLDFGQIALVLGITEGGARANGARALSRLRDWLGSGE